jgi:chemotaxis signal transduction protein
MREPWTESAERLRLTPDAAAWRQETVGIANIQRRLEERLTGLNQGADERIESPGRLLFWIEGIPYSTALSALRGALPSLPEITPLPMSPTWLVGLFPLRTDLVTLINLTVALRDGPTVAPENEASGAVAQHALLIGESGRLMAFLVDRIGDIFAENAQVSLPSGIEPGTTIGADQYVEVVNRSPSGKMGVAGLDIARIYSDMMAKLEAWARDA